MAALLPVNPVSTLYIQKGVLCVTPSLRSVESSIFFPREFVTALRDPCMAIATDRNME